MNNYIESDKLTGFPLGRRQGRENKNGVLLTESRLSLLVNSLLDINGFVVFPKPNTEITTGNHNLSINILGRYFKISDFNIENDIAPGSDDTNIFLGISIDSLPGDLYAEVVGQDNTSSIPIVYEGLKIFNSASSNGDNTYLSNGYTCVKVATKVNNRWYVPEPDLGKIDYIDCGEI